MRCYRGCCCCCTPVCFYGAACALVVLLALFVNEFQTCKDREYILFPHRSGASCALFKGLGACSALPFLARHVCGATCGWCDGRAAAEGKLGQWLDTAAAFAELAEDGGPRWRKVDRVNASLSYDDFVNRYKAASVPVIISGLSPLKDSPELSLDELVELCGDTTINLRQRPKFQLLAQLEQAGGLAHWVLDYQMRASWGLSLKDVIKLGVKQTLREFVAQVRQGRSAAKAKTKIDYTWLAHFMFPLSLDSYVAGDVCRKLLRRLVLPKYLTGHFLQCPTRVQEVIDWKAPVSQVDPPTMFISAADARPYPPHIHASEHHVFHFVLAGRKCFVHWPWDQWRHLYRLGISTSRAWENPEGITEDVLFLTEGIRQNFEVFPAMALSKAYYGCLSAGEMLYMPSGSIHSFESTEPALSLNFYGYDKWSNQCLRQMNEDPNFQRIPTKRLNELLRKLVASEVSPTSEPEPMSLAEAADLMCPRGSHLGTNRHIRTLIESYER